MQETSPERSNRDERKDTYIIDPENATEMARLTMQDRLITRTMGGVFNERERALFGERPEQILDVACGPGGWTLDAAFEYPETEVVGIDISQIMIEYARAQAWSRGLENVSFHEMDVLKRLDFSENVFDVVNARFMVAFLLRDFWPPVVRELYRVTRPGGYIRLTECDTPGITNSPACEQMLSWMGQLFKKIGYGFSPDGKSIGMTPMLPRLLRDAGCEEIQLQSHVMDFSSGSENHTLQCQNFMTIFYQAPEITGRTFKIAPPEEVEAVYNSMLAEMQGNDFLGLGYLLTAVGRKPLS